MGKHLLAQAPQRVPLLSLQQAVALGADHFPVQIVALVADQFTLVQLQGQQVAAAVGEPAYAVAVRAHGGGALVERVVFVLPYRHQRLAQAAIVLVLAHQVAGLVVEPLQAAVGVAGQREVAVAVVGEGFHLPVPLARLGIAGLQRRAAFCKTAHGVEGIGGNALPVHGARQLAGFFLVLVAGGRAVEAGFGEQAADRVVVKLGVAAVLVA